MLADVEKKLFEKFGVARRVTPLEVVSNEEKPEEKRTRVKAVK